MSPEETHLARLRLAHGSLERLSTGDAFGERFFVHPATVEQLIEARAIPASPWTYTDDTVMALSIVDVLAEKKGMDQELLARLFARRYRFEPARGYGGTAHDILTQISQGIPWREAAGTAFGGSGSMDNGAAMRVAPLGAYFAEDLEADRKSKRGLEVKRFLVAGKLS